METLTLQKIVKEGEGLFRSFRWGKSVYCPYCGSLHIYKGKGRYKCADCNARFTDKTGTLFQASKLSLTTIMSGIYLIMAQRGISSYILADLLGITQRTAWVLESKVRMTLTQRGLTVEGDVAADEMYVQGSLRFMHKPKKYLLAEKYNVELDNGKFTQRTAVTLTRRMGIPIVGLHDGKTLVMVKKKPILTSSEIEGVLDAFDGGITHLTVDESKLYKPISKWAKTEMCHKGHSYKTDGYSSNRIENPFGWYRGQYRHNHRHQSDRYIQGYVNEFVFRRNTKDDNLTERIGKAFAHFNSSKLTIKQLTA